MGRPVARNRVADLAPANFRKALLVAREIADPWQRCQALAWAARYAPEEQVEPVAREAITAALSSEDPYRQLGAAAWPLRALIERSHEPCARSWLSRLLLIAGRVSHPVSRVDALLLVWQAVFPLRRERKAVLAELKRACTAAHSWQAGRALYAAALMLAKDEPDAAWEWARSMPPGRYRRQAERALAAGETAVPRDFFWTQDSGATDDL